LEERCQRLSSEVASWENQCNVMGIENKPLRDALRQTDARLQYFEALAWSHSIIMVSLRHPWHLVAPSRHRDQPLLLP
jgi:hypothetical protein